VPFPRRLLNDHEEVILDLRPHWWALAGPAFVLVVCLAAAVVASFEVHGAARDPVVIALLVLVLVVLWWFVRCYLRWATTNFVLTTDRLISRSGILAKHGRELPLERVDDITFHQSLFERLMGAGDLMVESGGDRGQQVFARIPRPARVQNEIWRQVSKDRT
jgi:uncharacterized membrane protein YdbT with pleckstrin-like domain